MTPAAEARARAGLARLLRERDALGPVNLRATDEAAALAAEVQAAARGRDEVAAAAASLRGSLRRLDEEARSRLVSVFDAVDRHFQALFRRVFMGGQARLGLAGSDDPLQAGLDVQAQPPGKRSASLSLLSGGEQSLTALCLVLAVFRCNPAPVCVLDEVDAALDDANVERLCIPGAVGVPGWLRHHLTVSGPHAVLAAFVAAARGPGTVPWRHDPTVVEEDVLNLLLAQPPAERNLSAAGCRILARQVLMAVEARLAQAAARAGQDRACSLDLHALLPVPDALLGRGPDDPGGWSGCGRTGASLPRCATPRHGPAPPPGRGCGRGGTRRDGASSPRAKRRTPPWPSSACAGPRCGST